MKSVTLRFNCRIKTFSMSDRIVSYLNCLYSKLISSNMFCFHVNVIYSGKTSVIRVNGTQWIAHMVNALENLLNGLEAHRSSYTTISLEKDYSATQKGKAKFFLKQLNNTEFMSFLIFSLDICKAMSVFSKVC